MRICEISNNFKNSQTRFRTQLHKNFHTHTCQKWQIIRKIDFLVFSTIFLAIKCRSRKTLLNCLWTLKLNQLLYSTHILLEREKDAHVRFSFTWLERLRSYLIEVFGDSQNHKLTNYKNLWLFNILVFAVRHTPKICGF